MEDSQRDIMTLEEVANYLKVSERTVYGWAQKGKIPGGKIGAVWRFKRSELEQWVDNQLKTDEKSIAAEVTFRGVLSRERVLICDEPDKAGIIGRLVDIITQTSQIKDPEEFRREIFKREEMLSTGIGLGVGVPHVRLPDITDIVMAVGVNRKPIYDYEAFDGGPVRVVFIIAANTKQSAEYLRLLAMINGAMKDEVMRTTILNAADAETVYRALLN